MTMNKQKIILTILLLISSNCISGPIDFVCPQYVPAGAPIGKQISQELCKTGYAIGYSYYYKNPVYSVTYITPETLQAAVKRKDSFKEDKEIPAQYRATLNDYKSVHGQFDRGHMTPAGDLMWSYASMSDSFYLSNMVPQSPALNRGAWRQLEITVREWAQVKGSLYVITGPLYMSPVTSIGAGVAVPSYIFKIVYDPKLNSAIAFLVPNSDISVIDLPKYITTITVIEQLIGVDFFPNLPYNKKTMKNKMSTIEFWSTR